MVVAIDRVSETVAVIRRPAYHETSVYSELEVSGQRRHKQEVTLKPVLTPVKYADTAYVYINNTKKRFVSRVYYEPRVRPSSYADTTYVNPRTAQERFESFLDAYTDQTKNWFKTSVEIKPRVFHSTVSHSPGISHRHANNNYNSITTPHVTTNGHLPNGYFSHNFDDHLGTSDYANNNNALHEVDENMNRKIPVFRREAFDPGASQVYIPKRNEAAKIPINAVSLLNGISDQILINSSPPHLHKLDNHNHETSLNNNIPSVFSDL